MFLISEETIRGLIETAVDEACLDWDRVYDNEIDTLKQEIADKVLVEFKKNNKQNVENRSQIKRISSQISNKP